MAASLEDVVKMIAEAKTEMENSFGAMVEAARCELVGTITSEDEKLDLQLKSLSAKIDDIVKDLKVTDKAMGDNIVYIFKDLKDVKENQNEIIDKSKTHKGHMRYNLTEGKGITSVPIFVGTTRPAR